MIKYCLIVLVIIIVIISITFYFINEDYVTYDLKDLPPHYLPFHKNALLLTSYNTEHMEDKYVNVIKWWIKNSSFDIYVVNSSGKDFNTSFDNNRVTVFTFNQDMYTTKGKSSTHYELLSIMKILEKIPSMLTDYTMILKVTGKYKLPTLEKLVEQIPQSVDIIFQNKRNHISQNTELTGFKSDKIIDIINFAQDRDVVSERSMSKIKLENYITLRLPSIYIPENFRVSRGNGSILEYL
jgi:hypothetical protein